jgi:hypothetical protein
LVCADHPLTDMKADVLIGDTALDAGGRIIEPLEAAGKAAVIPPKVNRRSPRTFDRHPIKRGI